MAATLKDIAQQVGLSQVTVSKALRGTGRISVEARKRILEAAKKLRYRPNAGARSIRSGRTGIVGFVYSPEGMYAGLRTELLGGILETLRLQNYDLMLGEVSNTNLAQPGQVSELLRHWTADGLIINNQIDLPPSIVQLIEEDEVPAIWMNSKRPLNCVYFNDHEATKNATTYLLELGHRRVLYLDHSNPLALIQSHHYSVKERLEGYEAAMKEAGLKPMVSMEVDRISSEFRVQRCEKILTNSRRPTAIVNYGGVDPLMFACARLGFNVPQDLSLVHVAAQLNPINDVRIGTIYQPYQEMGIAAVRSLIARIQGVRGHSVPSTEIKMSFTPAGSCAPPKRAHRDKN